MTKELDLLSNAWEIKDSFVKVTSNGFDITRYFVCKCRHCGFTITESDEEMVQRKFCPECGDKKEDSA